jgi:hypothetical protein
LALLSDINNKPRKSAKNPSLEKKSVNQSSEWRCQVANFDNILLVKQHKKNEVLKCKNNPARLDYNPKFFFFLLNLELAETVA